MFYFCCCNDWMDWNEMCVNILDLLFLRHSSATWDERIFRYYTNISKEDPHSFYGKL